MHRPITGWGPEGPNCPHFWGLATPHEKSWFRPWHAGVSEKVFIDREAREIMHLVASVCPSVRLSVRPSVCNALLLEGVITNFRCLSVCL